MSRLRWQPKVSLLIAETETRRAQWRLHRDRPQKTYRKKIRGGEEKKEFYYQSNAEFIFYYRNYFPLVRWMTA